MECAAEPPLTLLDLPQDVLYHLCTFLDGRELAIVASTCSRLKDLADEDILWKQLLRRTFGRGGKLAIVKNQSPKGQHQPSDVHLAQRQVDWRRTYAERKRIWDHEASLDKKLVRCAEWDADILFREVVRAQGRGRVQSNVLLHCACTNANPKMAKMLIEEFGAKINAPSGQVMAPGHQLVLVMVPLASAAEGGDVELVCWMMGHPDILIDACVLASALICSAAEKHLAMTRLFLDRIQSRMQRSNKSLWNWVTASATTAATTTTAAAAASPTASSHDGPFTEEEKAMLENAKLVALERASRDGSIAIVRELVYTGKANVRHPSCEALYNACALGGDMEIVNELLKNGANVNAAMASGWTALHAAAELGNIEIIKVLVEHGADAGATIVYHGDTNQTPYMVALRSHGDPAVVEYLRSVPSPVQQHAQQVLKIALVTLTMVLASTVYFVYG